MQKKVAMMKSLPQTSGMLQGQDAPVLKTGWASYHMPTLIPSPSELVPQPLNWKLIMVVKIPVSHPLQLPLPMSLRAKPHALTSEQGVEAQFLPPVV
ncbi:hypothetical protein FRC11_002475, partial [Ceratobasidium sp. 423]